MCFFSSLSFFYEDPSKCSHLTSIFQKNVKMFENSFGISSSQLPSLLEIQNFCFQFSLENKNQSSFKELFIIWKECWIWLISIYEILFNKWFLCFVIWNKKIKNLFNFRKIVESRMEGNLSLFAECWDWNINIIFVQTPQKFLSFILNKWNKQQDDLLKQCIRFLNLIIVCLYLLLYKKSRWKHMVWPFPSKQNKLECCF